MYKFQTITELLTEIKFGLESQYHLIEVTGEISKITTIQKGNVFFDIKDENHIISCFALNQHIVKFKNPIKDKTMFTIIGKLTVFKGGKINILVYGAEYVNIGLINKKQNELFLKLQKEGYFLTEHKKQIQQKYNSIGLITAKQGAVIHDITQSLEQRFPKKIFLYPSQMQGLDAINSILNGINYFNLNFLNKIDAILLARGGGSLEDLSIFNSEKLVKGIFNSKIPVISAIGHSQDKTLTDLVSDFSTKTPTSAAEYLSPHTIKDYKKSLNSLIYHINNNQNKIFLIYTNKITYFNNVSTKFKNQLILHEIKIFNLYSNIVNKIQKIIFNNQIKIEKKQETIITSNKVFINKISKINIFSNQIIINVNKLIHKNISNINHFLALINQNNIHTNLQKGYSILTNQDNIPINSIKSLKENQEYFIHLQDGKKEIIIKK